MNHVLPYDSLYAANVFGTREIIRLCFLHHKKRLNYVSTLSVVPTGTFHRVAFFETG